MVLTPTYNSLKVNGNKSQSGTTMANIIYRATNTDDGVEARITEGHMGFHVTLFDLDAEAPVGITIGTNSLDVAITKANEIIG